MTARPHNWPDKMAEAIDKHRGLPFSWGISDCWVMPLDVARAITGELPPDDRVNFAYRSEKGAALNLRRAGCANVGDAFALLYEEIHPSQAGRGDIVTVDKDGVTGGGVCVGAHIICKASPEGISFLQRSDIARAFRVP